MNLEISSLYGIKCIHSFLCSYDTHYMHKSYKYYMCGSDTNNQFLLQDSGLKQTELLLPTHAHTLAHSIKEKCL